MSSHDLQRSLVPLLREALGNELAIKEWADVHGGDINDAAQITLDDGQRLFLKYNEAPLPKLFEIEARGLALLKEANAIRVPEVTAYHEATPECPAFLVLEWIESEPGRDDVMRQFGRQLAELHRISSATYGLDHNNYIGSLNQCNLPTSSWIEFYRDRRLGAQCALAQANGRMPSHRRRRLDQLMERLGEFIPEEGAQPSLLHGDLWGGNYMISHGEAVLIDPAVYFGHREVEIAFTQLFGGFSSSFYDGYDEVWPLDPLCSERKALYQLYPLLVHLNLFGESYGSRVDGILKHLVG